MAFQHEDDTASDVPDFFTNLEALLVAAGWTLVSGGGSTDIVYTSSGEAGTLTKLYIRIWRDGPNPERVYFRVQDDAAATHATSTANVNWVEAPALGAIAFKYWITATKDFLVFVFRVGAGYTGCYVGILEPFAATPPDERMYIVSVGFLNFNARVLERYDGTWDYLCSCNRLAYTYNPNDLDGSRPIFGEYVYNSSDERENYGQMLYTGGAINDAYGDGINPEDTIASSYPASTSQWMIFGTGGLRRALATAEGLPAGQGDGANWGYTTGVAANIGELQAALEAFVIARGWVVGAWPVPVDPIDRSFSSVGENGTETIVLRWFWDGATWAALIYDAIGGTHYTNGIKPGNDRIYGADWPVRYWFTGDKDCFVVIIELSGIMEWAWYGLCKSFYGDPSLVATEYRVGGFNDAFEKCLRRPDGNWNGDIAEWYDAGITTSSPNLIDGKTFIVWPYVLCGRGAGNNVAWGMAQYLYRMWMTGLPVGHTVQAGPHVYMYIGGYRGVKIA